MTSLSQTISQSKPTGLQENLLILKIALRECNGNWFVYSCNLYILAIKPIKNTYITIYKIPKSAT